ncbi:protein OF MAMMALIAN LYST-INTERACTING PROTEIN 5-like isoform X1 [Capsicum chacoense]
MYILEILEQFGELQRDLQQKHKYAVWKAADIRKAIKERQKPVPGLPGGDDGFSLSGLPGGESDNRDFSAAQSGKHI